MDDLYTVNGVGAVTSKVTGGTIIGNHVRRIGKIIELSFRANNFSPVSGNNGLFGIVPESAIPSDNYQFLCCGVYNNIAGSIMYFNINTNGEIRSETGQYTITAVAILNLIYFKA